MLDFSYDISLLYSYGSLTCRQMLRHGTYSFAFPQKEVLLRVSLSPLKIYRPRGLNPRSFGTVASTLLLDHRQRQHSSYNSVMVDPT